MLRPRYKFRNTQHFVVKALHATPHTIITETSQKSIKKFDFGKITY